MKILISGGTGFIGTALINNLCESGYQISVLTRNPDRAIKQFGNKVNAIQWDGISIEPLKTSITGCEIVINLIGEGIANKLWTKSQKKKIYDSRILATNALVTAVNRYSDSITTFISGSAVGIYNDTPRNTVDESSAYGNNFLSKVCIDWENEVNKLQKASIRKVWLRTGLVLGKNGGVLNKLILPFKLGLGGALGSGKQYMNWIHISDMITIISRICSDTTINGAVNLVSPENVTNHQFTKILGKILCRPTIFAVPSFILKLILGELSTVLLTGPNVIPTKLLNANYAFKYPCLETALKQLLHK